MAQLDEAQALTRRTYEDVELAQAFLKSALNTHKDLVSPHIRAFAESLAGSRLIDIGCGPGVHARQFADLGLQVTAIDYSEAMVQIAKEQSTADNPAFLHLDMREIGKTFAAHSFDGAWIAASLIHIPEPDVAGLLRDIHNVLAPGGRAQVSLKAGDQGPRMVYDDKYGKGIERQFIFWQEDNFTLLLREAGFTIDHVETMQAGVTGNQPTTWLVFHTCSTNPKQNLADCMAEVLGTPELGLNGKSAWSEVEASCDAPAASLKNY